MGLKTAISKTLDIEEIIQACWYILLYHKVFWPSRLCLSKKLTAFLIGRVGHCALARLAWSASCPRPLPGPISLNHLAWQSYDRASSTLMINLKTSTSRKGHRKFPTFRYFQIRHVERKLFLKKYLLWRGVGDFKEEGTCSLSGMEESSSKIDEYC